MRNTQETWTFVAGADNTGSDPEATLGSIIDREGFHVARIWSDAPRKKRNACLIVAAPDLLNALKHVIKSGCSVADIEHAKSIIKKVEGKI